MLGHCLGPCLRSDRAPPRTSAGCRQTRSSRGRTPRARPPYGQRGPSSTPRKSDWVCSRRHTQPAQEATRGWCCHRVMKAERPPNGGAVRPCTDEESQVESGGARTAVLYIPPPGRRQMPFSEPQKHPLANTATLNPSGTPGASLFFPAHDRDRTDRRPQRQTCRHEEHGTQSSRARIG